LDPLAAQLKIENAAKFATGWQRKSVAANVGRAAPVWLRGPFFTSSTSDSSTHTKRNLACYDQVMKTVKRGQSSQDSAIRQPLLEFRHALLDLHKALIDSERAVYEADVGPVQSPHHFFQLLTTDPWFAWLRPISQLIVMIDEVLDAQEPLTNNNIDAVIIESVFLLVPAKGEGEFSARYLAALQRDPAVVLAHAQVAKRIPPGKPRA
jgi:hypothetical protein